jgi:hypothetical protein
MRTEAKLRGGGTILMHGAAAKDLIGSPPPRIVIGCRWRQPKPKAD